MKIHHVVENKIKGVDGKACWPGKRYAGRKKKPDGSYKDICVPVDESTKPGQLDEISANPDYLRAAERSRSQAQATQRTFGKSPEEKAAARRTEINRDKGIAGYTKRHKAAHPEMYPKIEPRPAPQLRDPSTEYSDDYSVWAKGRRDTMEQDVAEASPETTLNLLKGLKTWQVVIMNNYYRGKYSDYSGRYYYVLASSPEEARQVVLDNADAILQDLLSMKSVNGKKILPRGSAIAITDKRIGDIKDGTEAGRMTTAGFKRMFGPQGPMMVKLSGGAVVDVQGQEQGVAEAAGLYGPFTVTINTGERPQSRTKTKKFRREDDAILWAQDWLEDFSQYPFATAEVTDPDGNVVWTTDEEDSPWAPAKQGVAEGAEPGKLPSLSRTQYGLIRKLRSAIEYKGQNIPSDHRVRFTDMEKQDLDNLLLLVSPSDSRGAAILKKAINGIGKFDPSEKPIIDKTFNELLQAPMRDPGLKGRGASYTGPGVTGNIDPDAFAQGFNQSFQQGMTRQPTQPAPMPSQTPPPVPGTMANPIRKPGKFMGPAVMATPRLKEQGVAEGEYKSRHIHRQEQNKKYDEYCRSQEAAGKKPMSRGDWAATQRKGQKQGVAEGYISQLEKDIADAPVKPIASMESATDSDGYSVDQEDAGEYDYEGDQAKDQLQTIVAAARKLDGILDDNENMPEWVQMKITKATDYLDTAADYVAANKAQAEPMAEGEPEKIGGRHNPDDFDAMVGRLKKLAGAGPLKTVYDPNTRRYKNVPTAVQPKDKK